MNRFLLLFLSIFTLNLFGSVLTPELLKTNHPSQISNSAKSKTTSKKFQKAILAPSLMDTVPPELTCPASDFITILTQGACDTVLNYSVTATDDQGPAIVIQLSGLASGAVFPIGVNTCVYLATDLSGNTATCSFSITVQDDAITSLVCNDLLEVELDANCTKTLAGKELLEGGPYGCWNRYLAEVDKTIPFGNGPWLTPAFGAADIGKTYQGRITDSNTGNKCWGNVKIVDKTPPVFNCKDLTISCAEHNRAPEFLRDSLGLADAVPQAIDACGPLTFLGHTDTKVTLTCDTVFTEIINRQWQANDASGNTSSCIQRIKAHRHTLNEMQLPPDITLNCPDTNIAPVFTGQPFLIYQGSRYDLENNSICDLSAFHTDHTQLLACGDRRILRMWEFFDFCSGITEGPFVQNIYVLDETRPTIACPGSMLISVNADTCYGLINLPDAVLSDACSEIASFQAFWSDNGLSRTLQGSLADFPGNDPLDTDTMGVMGTALFPVGTTTVAYVVEDSCGNIGDCTFNLTVADMVKPVVQCNSFSNLQLLSDGFLYRAASTFDNGSTDACTDLSFKARFLSPSACLFDTLWTDTLGFCCLNLSDTIDAVLRVYDIPAPVGTVSGSFGNGHFSDCALKIVVTDPNPPTCVAPQNLTVNCTDFDPTLEAYGIITSTSCSVDSVSLEVDYTQFDTACSQGNITRVFKVFDAAGNVGACAQAIKVDYLQDYFIKFPDDMIVTACSGPNQFGQPSFLSQGCEELNATYTDEVFTVVPDACFKIERSWKITNRCTYDSLAPIITVPNPTPNSVSNAPINLPGPVVSACGTLGPWSPSTVKINPTDPAATNYCTFYNKNANGYKYKQIIKVIDSQAPTATYATPACANQNWASLNNGQLWNETYWWDPSLEQHDLCEEATDLSITATDACSGSNINIEYLLFLDLDNDGVMETVVNSVNTGLAGLGWNNVLYYNINTPNFSGGSARSFDERPVMPNQKMGFAIEETVSGNQKIAHVRWNTQETPNTYFNPELPHGTHKIKWFITDQCGNNKEYEYTFTVRDCKPPVVTCLLNGLTVNILPTGLITFYASDFLQYTEDNCTPANQLRIGIRKCGTGTGFPFDANGNPIPTVTYTCNDLGPQCIELWSIDKAGNADHCETNFTIQDNSGSCGDPGASISGYIKTEQSDGIEGVTISVDGTVNFAPPFSYFFLNETDMNGYYSINSNIPISADFTVAPELDVNPLNGVTTYDLVLISKHILGITPFDSPYKMISADANKSGSVTTFDMVELRKLILGIYTELPNNTSWRFVDSSFVFPNPQNPFQTAFPEIISILNILNNMNGLDFIGMKVGDVNNTAIPNLNAAAEERFEGTVYFNTEAKEVREGEVFELSFEASELLEGCQFTLETEGLEILEVLPGANMSKDNFALFPQKNLLTMAWETGGQAAFTLRLKAKQSGSIREMLKISNQITRAEGYKIALDPNAPISKSRLALRFGNSEAPFELFQNQPNPFSSKTAISFQLPVASEGTLRVLDATGKVLWSQKGNWPAGLNTVELNLGGISAAGVLYYKLETPDKSAVRKMVRI